MTVSLPSVTISRASGTQPTRLSANCTCHQISLLPCGDPGPALIVPVLPFASGPPHTRSAARGIVVPDTARGQRGSCQTFRHEFNRHIFCVAASHTHTGARK